MSSRILWSQKSRYIGSVFMIYLATLLFAFYIFAPYSWLHKNQASALQSLTSLESTQPVQTTPEQIVTVGKPVRILVPSLQLDLPVDEGIYNPEDGSWTLTDFKAHFAVPSSLANDVSGNTILYGHNNKRVFGRLTKLNVGDTIEVFTDNEHVFTYTYEGFEDVKPDNVEIFEYQGPPIVTIQTCTGNWNELRRMYRFKLDKVV